MLRGAIIGVGNVALRGHLPAWLERENVALVAASDPSEAGRRELESRVAGIRWHASVEELLGREELDFVDICAPPAAHADLARRALLSGRHVLCEKPLVIRPEEIPPLAEASARADRVLFTVHNWRYAPILAKARELAAEGAIGKVRRYFWETVRREPAESSMASNWRLDPAISGGGILADHGWHAFSLLADWLPQAPRRIAAHLEKRRGGEVEDTARVLLDYDGARAEVFLTWAGAERANRARIEGSRGALELDGKVLELTGSGGGRGKGKWEFPEPLSQGSHHPDRFAGVVADFLGEIAEREFRGRNLAVASLCAVLVAAAYESTRRGGEPVPLSGGSPVKITSR
jgi:predicted dehydrogenase